MTVERCINPNYGYASSDAYPDWAVAFASAKRGLWVSSGDRVLKRRVERDLGRVWGGRHGIDDGRQREHRE